jgi:serine/threonine protein phosphatase PrpC
MNIQIKMAAWSDRAGRSNNEDNFLVSKNISANEWSFDANETLALDEKGSLLVVCDGMGGMNAGEVASAIAVDTIKEWFSLEKLTKDVTGTPEAILRHIETAIIAADAKIKAEAARDEEKEGMGSTIVLAWLIGKNAYIGWCGDSRAYRFNPALGIERLTRDHSYVQGLIDAGKLSPKLALGHPQSNIITRSLGDSSKEAQPDTNSIPLYNNDMILLCSDGLSGILSDNDMEDILMKTTGDVKQCLTTLLSESEKVGWQDNVTIALCCILSGGGKAVEKKSKPPKMIPKWKVTALLLSLIFTVMLLLPLAFGGGYYCGKKEVWKPWIGDSIDVETPVLGDSVKAAKDTIKNEKMGKGETINKAPDNSVQRQQ